MCKLQTCLHEVVQFKTQTRRGNFGQWPWSWPWSSISSRHSNQCHNHRHYHSHNFCLWKDGNNEPCHLSRPNGMASAMAGTIAHVTIFSPDRITSAIAQIYYARDKSRDPAWSYRHVKHSGKYLNRKYQNRRLENNIKCFSHSKLFRDRIILFTELQAAILDTRACTHEYYSIHQNQSK